MGYDDDSGRSMVGLEACGEWNVFGRSEADTRWDFVPHGLQDTRERHFEMAGRGIAVTSRCRMGKFYLASPCVSPIICATVVPCRCRARCESLK
jgi:hypothetical protein